VERGETTIVGVNKFTEGSEPPVIAAPDYSALERGQVARLGEVRANRDADACRRALEGLARATGTAAAAPNRSGSQLMPRIVDAVRARASVGEISDVLSAAWGTYRPGT
jgi:methylmalonyl-CoA mutase N-terminal domain/subunit